MHRNYSAVCCGCLCENLCSKQQHDVPLFFFPPSGGGREGLSEGARTRRVGVTESDVVGDVAVRTTLSHIVGGQVQRGGQKVRPTSDIIRAERRVPTKTSS